jgi:TRAP-type uncharacterized transport system substrate-binding protein
MFRYTKFVLTAAMAILAGISGTSRTLSAATTEAIIANKGVVELETGRAPDLSVRMAEEIATIIDDGATRRVVPVVGKGPFQNLTDLKYLRGIDLGIVPADALYAAREQKLLPGIESLTYVAKLYNEEFHLLARGDIKTVADLADQTVNVDLKASSTSITATRLLGLLHVSPKLATDDRETALQKLRNGEIAALAFVAAKPEPFFSRLTTGNGLHLLSIPLNEAIAAAYAPSRLTATDYPGLVTSDRPVDTVAVGNVMMAADVRMIPERYRNLSNFINTFFTGFPELLKPGHDSKWQEVTITAEFPGWARHPAAQQWLQNNNQIAAAPTPEAMRALFSRFIDERRQASGGVAMSAADKASLFQQFEAWQRGQAH